MRHAVTLMCEPDEVVAINKHLERQGYGPANVSAPVKNKGASLTTAGYMLDTVADDGFRASLVKMGKGTRHKRVIDESLQERRRKDKQAKKEGKQNTKDQQLDKWGVEEKKLN